MLTRAQFERRSSLLRRKWLEDVLGSNSQSQDEEDDAAAATGADTTPSAAAAAADADRAARAADELRDAHDVRGAIGATLDPYNPNNTGLDDGVDYDAPLPDYMDPVAGQPHGDVGGLSGVETDGGEEPYEGEYMPLEENEWAWHRGGECTHTHTRTHPDTHTDTHARAPVSSSCPFLCLIIHVRISARTCGGSAVHSSRTGRAVCVCAYVCVRCCV